MKNQFLLFIVVLYLSFFISCIPNTETQNTDISISLSDPELQKILDLKDKQDAPSLYKYFRHKNPAYRYHSVLAFGSIKNPAACDSLILMLKDPVIEIRAAAAFALGQTGDGKFTDRLIPAFNGKDTLNINNIFNANILEAVGKLGNLSDLKAIATVKTYRNTDSLLLLGQARAIYCMGLRNIVSDEGTSRMVDLLYLESTPEDVQLIAANYLGRTKNLNLSLYTVRLTEVFGREKNPDISMSLATAFGNTKDVNYLPSLKAKLISEPDYRVKCNIIRSLAGFPYPEIRDLVLQNLKNENLHIAITAANTILSNGKVEDVLEYMKYDNDSIPWQVRSKMNGAVLTHTALYFTKSKLVFTDRILKNIKETESVYAKAAYVESISKDPYNYLILIRLYNDEKEQIIKIAALEGLGNILRNPLFFKAFGNGFGKVKGEILNVFISAIGSGDVGQISEASKLLSEPQIQWKEWIKDPVFLKDALKKLKLPRDIEAFNELKSCIYYIEGIIFTPERLTYNHAIDWAILQTLSDSSIAAIKTSKGLIRIQLNKGLAPSTVANFVSLVNEKFYNGKIFHRVVPNFVVQTGCPRGDGYGSLDYSIRSELPQIYFNKQGLIGMASSGNHTENTQWFITHSPAMHLNGNYTIFGKVIEGMDVVNNIQIGDKITEIILVK
ncbi:MAG: peptidylprolyl isomerase [Saprospiraceae bacterium]|nr:peptidylprolyl isomerase [Saprospiraceae bacterium]